MRRRWTSTLAIVAWGVATVLVAGASPAGACSPIYNDLAPNQGQLLGCCAANGTLMAAGTNCINPDNTCQAGDCTSSGTCGPKSDGSYNSANRGDACHVPNVPCYVGTCRTQSCNDALPVCDDHNPCTTDNCSLNTSTTQYPLDVTCGTHDPTSGGFCGITNGTDTCTRGTCTSGTCNPSGTTDTCTDPPSECQIAKCIGYDTNQVKICNTQNLDEFTACNTGAWTQCLQYSCSPGGSCRQRPQNGATCNPTPCTQRQCDNSGNCDDGTLVNLADGTACPDNGTECKVDQCVSGVCDHNTNKADGTACADNNTQCKIDQCISGVCDHNANSPAGTGCIDVNPCHLPQCDGAGGCGVPNTAANGNSCSVYCTDSGICTNGICDAITCKPNTTPCNYCGGKCNPTPPPGVAECTCG